VDLGSSKEPVEPLIRRARPADLDAIMRLERALFPPADRFSRSLYRGFLRRAPDLVLVAELDGAVVGCAAGGVDAVGGHMQTLGVDPAAQRHGVGRALAERLLAGFGTRGVRRVGLEVRVGNAAAIALYRSLGFVEAGMLPGYYPDGEDGLWMEWVGEEAPRRSD
jgi:ribosomal-protein-alanine N-acetyltransferase